MPLSKPAPRKHIHTRDIKCLGFERDDGLWDIEGRLTDTKTYTFDNHDRGGIAAGEAIHDMLIRLTVTGDMVVQAAEASTESSPFSMCGDVTQAFSRLVGLKIGPGWRKAVDEAMGIVLLRMNFGDTGSYGDGNALIVWEAFKVYDDQIHAVEAFMEIMPADAGSGWD